MKQVLSKIGAFLCKTWVWSLCLVLALALWVWFVGPLLAVDDYKFWADASARGLSISVLFLLWGLGMVFASWRSGVRKQALQDSENGQARVERDALIEHTDKRLRDRFKAALRTLKTASLYRGRNERWRSELPWYLLVGPPESGKTSLLEHSGLEFPINQRDPQAPQATRDCDWYFTDHGVLLDTAGRYLTQPDTNVDRSGWGTLLELLHQRRRTRPLNGVLVTLPVERLLSADASGLDSLALQVRARLQEVHQRLHVDLPVYLVLSKADELPGFAAFFEQLTREECEQVLGASFDKAQRGANVERVRDEFQALLRRLDSQVLMRLHQERDPQDRGRILDFPQQMAQIGAPLCQFVDKAFSGNRYQRASQLRGFYLTSAAPPSTAPDQETAEPLAGQSGARPRFIHHLLDRVIFPEANLVGLDTRERRRIHWGQRTVYVGALAVVAAGGGLWATGFSANHERLEQVRNLAHTWRQQRAQLSDQDDALAALNVLDTRYAATQVFPAAGNVPWFERTGLDQGRASQQAVTQAYQHELRSQLLPRISQLLEAQTRSHLGEREPLLNSLRAYLMLNLEARRDRAWLKDWVAQDWSRRYAGNTAVQDGLVAHLERLLALPFVEPLNESLVTQARQALRNESLAGVVYRMLREQARDLPAYRFSQHLGPQAHLLVGTDYVIPGFYTQRGYQQYFAVQSPLLVTQILRDNWVLGEGATLSGMDMRRLLVELEQLYLRDYADHWGEAVGRVALQPINDIGEGAEQLAGLTSAHSPVLQLLVQVRDNTRFTSVIDSVSDVAGGVAGKAGVAGELASAVAGKANEALASQLPDTAKQAVQRRFEPLHQLLDAQGGPAADLIPALNALNDLHLQLASLARASAPEQAAYELAKGRMNGQRDALSALRTTSGRLPRPVSAWFNGLAHDTWRLTLNDAYRYLDQRYQSELYSFYRKAINTRYPFSAHSSSDVALNDFREFFKAQGVVERFYDSYLRTFVSGVPGNYRARSIDGQSLPISRAYLDQMSTAHVIRQSFFAETPGEPQVRFTLAPYTLDPAVSRAELRFGDNTLEYRHGPIVPVTYTWPNEAHDGRASLVLERTAERPIGIEKHTGPWSLFRLFDLMPREYLKGRDVLVLKADLGGLRANYLLTSQRMPNPFDMGVLRTFRLPVQL
ncbi:type VI secretion system protein ImpL [Pseudomonas sp. ok272]|uniref:type VI secretion system membrane subunit TssM n=1 Tax=unclassified Pseudomonas TaxID=196821 RepID=UPI0008B0D417|nr:MULTISPECIES: type VI secretion system membrane subunit TssM [unclassified Pseudomonas]SEM60373.1 type VI secretion system protein ImpL [Pseudomonas sp. ok272]SFM49988.1 type VI secretion system protein ImpL [Pseudomonas sp. ok602]